MRTFVIVTTADPTRPGLSYKLEMPGWSIEEWYTNNIMLLQSKRDLFVNEGLDPNTSITMIEGNGKVTVEKYHLSWEQLTNLLRQAEDTPASAYDEGRGPGRPEKRVLVLTTSKERRTGALVARTGF